MQPVEQESDDSVAFLCCWRGTRQLGVVSGRGRVQGHRRQARSRRENLTSGVELPVSFAVKTIPLLISAGLCACTFMQKQIN